MFLIQFHGMNGFALRLGGDFFAELGIDLPCESRSPALPNPPSGNAPQRR